VTGIAAGIVCGVRNVCAVGRLVTGPGQWLRHIRQGHGTRPALCAVSAGCALYRSAGRTGWTPRPT